MVWWTGLAPWEFEFPFPGSLTSTFLMNILRASCPPTPTAPTANATLVYYKKATVSPEWGRQRERYRHFKFPFPSTVTHTRHPSLLTQDIHRYSHRTSTVTHTRHPLLLKHGWSNGGSRFAMRLMSLGDGCTKPTATHTRHPPSLKQSWSNGGV